MMIKMMKMDATEQRFEWERLRDYASLARRPKAEPLRPLPPPQQQQQQPKRSSAVFNHSSLFRKRRKTENNSEENADDTDDLDFTQLADDTLAACTLLRKQFPVKALPFCPRVVLTHQLYSVVKNKTTVDRALEKARSQKQLFKFRLPSQNAEYFVLSREDYFQFMDAAKASLLKSPVPNVRNDIYDRLWEVMSSTEADVAISRKTLEEQLKATEDELKFLVHTGFLSLNKENAFWFAVPNIGTFMVNLVNGRTDILAILKRRKYQEMMEKQLVQKRLRRSVLGWQFHLSDLQGLNRIQSTQTGEGNLIRLSAAQP